MSLQTSALYDPELDLVLERVIETPPERVWAAWTEPQHVVKWFTPAPWSTTSCDIELRPGGKFNFVMRSPEGQEFPNSGCILEVIPNRRLIWTSSLTRGFRPAAGVDMPFHFTGIISIEPSGTGSKYTATVMHANAEARKKHAEMGFQDGWGKALDQLVACMK